MSKLNWIERNKAIKWDNMAFIIVTSNDFAIIWTHICDIESIYFINVTFISEIMTCIFYFFSTDIVGKKVHPFLQWMKEYHHL